jgi:hypothetical protein
MLTLSSLSVWGVPSGPSSLRRAATTEGGLGHSRQPGPNTDPLDGPHPFTLASGGDPGTQRGGRGLCSTRPGSRVASASRRRSRAASGPLDAPERADQVLGPAPGPGGRFERDCEEADDGARGRRCDCGVLPCHLGPGSCFQGAHQVESYLGLVPMEWSSSETQRRGTSRRQVTAACGGCSWKLLGACSLVERIRPPPPCENGRSGSLKGAAEASPPLHWHAASRASCTPSGATNETTTLSGLGHEAGRPGASRPLRRTPTARATSFPWFESWVWSAR